MLSRLRQSLFIKVGVASAAMVLTVALSVSYFSFQIAMNQIEQSLDNELDTLSSVISTHLTNQLGNIVNNLSDLAGNSLLANALADSQGRDKYLIPYLNSFKSIGGLPMHVYFCAFNGQLIADNTTPALTDPPSTMARQIVDSGVPQMSIARNREQIVVTIGWPVLYANTGLPEGALFYQFSLLKLAEQIFANAIDQRPFTLRATRRRDGEAHEFIVGAPPEGRSITRRKPVAGPPVFDGWALDVEVAEQMDRLDAEIRKLVSGYYMLGVLGILSIITASLMGARLLLSRLNALESTANRVVATRSLELTFPERGNDEIANLGRAFNQMLEDLRKANEELQSEAGEEIRRHSQKMRRVLAETLEGYVRVDVDSSLILEVNEAFCRMAGRDCELWNGELAPGELLPFVHRGRELNDAASWSEEIQMTASNGEPGLFVLVHCLLDIDEDGQKTIIGFLSDITERKQAEKQLRFLGAITDHMSDAIIATDASFAITYINEKAEELFGYPLEELRGRTPAIFNADTVAAATQAVLEETVSAGGIFSGESLSKKKDGSTFYCEYQVMPLFGEDGSPYAYIGIQRDITDRKRAEQAILETNAHLKDALAYANEMAQEAEKANMAKSQFLANMSHEIRTPLNAIIGMAELLGDTPMNPEQRQYARVINSAGENLLALINDILDLSKVESGQIKLERTDFDLAAQVEQVIEGFAFPASAKGLKIDWRIDGNVPRMVRGDPLRLRQILFNLIGNAVKFTVAGDIFVEITKSEAGGHGR